MLHSHRNILFDVLKFTTSHGISARDRVSHLLSPSVIGGLREILSALLNGACLSAYDFRASGIDDLADWLRRERISICRVVPSILRPLMRSLGGASDFPCLRLVYAGGEALLPGDVAQFRAAFGAGCRLVNIFGATEYGLCCQHALNPDTPASTPTVPIGAVFDGIRVRLVDESGADAEGVGTAGEMIVESRFLAPGYWNCPELTAELFRDVPGRPGCAPSARATWPDGRRGVLEHLGRRDGQVQVRGNRVELAEVEDVLLSSAAVEDAVVIARRLPDAVRLVAFVVSCGDTGPTQLRGWCAERLPEFALPSEFRLVAALPRTAQGKIDRRALAEMEPPAPQAPQGVTASADELEGEVGQLWKAVLGTESVPADADFFVQGGDSLLAMELLLRVNRQFGVALRPDELIAAKTLPGLVRLVRQWRASREDSPFVVLQEGRNRNALYLLHGGLGDVFSYRHLVSSLPPDLRVVGVDPSWGVIDRLHPLRFEDLARDHVAKLRRFQPSGPYRLAGYSFGGVLVFEIALQLRACGRDVDFVGLFDCFAPHGVRRQPAHTVVVPLLRNLPAWMADEFACRWHGPCRGRAAARAGRSREARRTEAAADLAGSSRSVQEVYGHLAISHQARAQKLLDSIDTYVPGPYAGQLRLFNARVRPLRHSFRPAETWRQLTGADIPLVTIPGNHESIMRPPCVDHLAVAVGEHLRSLPWA